ncbi:MAG: hypothetical protein BWY98_00034 [Tenericutes bacterium ADurb.BinA155]|jgi:hypothetical protein|nr:MAG: hypothetical protein BWY98_00034 [Tenericutes bacterium ADurb.BinA155]
MAMNPGPNNNSNPTPQDSFVSTLPVEADDQEAQKGVARTRVFWLFVFFSLIVLGFLIWEIADLVLALK